MLEKTTQLSSSPASIHEYFGQIRIQLANDIKAKSDNEILNVNGDTYARFLADGYMVSPAELSPDQVTISHRDEAIPRDHFPPEFSVMNPTVKKPVITFHLPFKSGDSNFFKFLHPGTSVKPILCTSEICLEYIDFYTKPERIRSQFDQDLSYLTNAFNQLYQTYAQFNATLAAVALKEITLRKDQVLRNSNYLASFNIPIHQNQNTPKTFNIPDPKLRKKILVAKPEFSDIPYSPDPTMDYSIYLEILKLIDDMGRNFERMPSVYEGKDEESLRDHILFVLDPHFEMGSATGETFNKAGKTDIQLRYNSEVVFIAECKFWHGMKAFHETIDQLLGYLTWRDSKVALVLFVKNKEFMPVLNTIKEGIPSHPQYLRINHQRAKNWLEYSFHLPNDPAREIRLTIMAFHTPSKV